MSTTTNRKRGGSRKRNAGRSNTARKTSVTRKRTVFTDDQKIKIINKEPNYRKDSTWGKAFADVCKLQKVGLFRAKHTDKSQMFLRAMKKDGVISVA